MVQVEEFVHEMFSLTAADFGLLTCLSDLKAKNTVASSYSYKGMSLESGVPGIYWTNFFSNELALWLGIEDFPRELAEIRHLAGGGVLLEFCELPEQCRDFEVLQKQRAAIEWLGSEKFFDIDHPARKAVTPDWNKLSLQFRHLPE